MKMDAAVKAKWVAALQSGDYAQGKGVLRMVADSPEGKPQCCCLGVLCEVLELPKTIGDYMGGGKHSYFTYGKTDPTSGVLGADAVRAARFEEISGRDDVTNPYVVIDGEAQHLSTHNDHGRTFAEIATAIQEQL